MSEIDSSFLDEVPVSMGDLRLLLRVVEVAYSANLAVDLQQSYRSMNDTEGLSRLTAELGRAQARIEGYLEEGRKRLDEQVEQADEDPMGIARGVS